MQNEIQIIDYQPIYLHRWKAINEAWIEQSFFMEEIDRQHCDFPEESILSGGGSIMLALLNGEVIGTAGILKDDDQTFELIKMAVDERYRGHGIGPKLCEAAILRAKNMGAHKFYLFSNTGGSGDAVKIYRKLGFAEVPLERQDFVRANIQMEMHFPPLNVPPGTLSFPLGKFSKPDTITPLHLENWQVDIASLPALLRQTVASLTDYQLDTPYRPGGWTIRQVIHHLADSHLNAHARLHLALTEDAPVIKPYDQTEWAKLPDGRYLPLHPSLQILEGVHYRWTYLLSKLAAKDWKRTFIHPEHGRIFSVEEMTGMYAHHGNNHLAQIQALLKRNKWE